MAYCLTMAQESESRNLDKVIVRLPDGMRDRIKAAAEVANRSMNAEIVATLEEKYPAPIREQVGRLAAIATEMERVSTLWELADSIEEKERLALRLVELSRKLAFIRGEQRWDKAFVSATFPTSSDATEDRSHFPTFHEDPLPPLFEGSDDDETLADRINRMAGHVPRATTGQPMPADLGSEVSEGKTRGRRRIKTDRVFPKMPRK